MLPVYIDLTWENTFKLCQVKEKKNKTGNKTAQNVMLKYTHTHAPNQMLGLLISVG